MVRVCWVDTGAGTKEPIGEKVAILFKDNFGDDLRAIVV